MNRRAECPNKNTKHVRVRLVLGTSEFTAVVDLQTDVWIWGSATNLCSLDSTGRVNDNLDDTNSGVEWFTREHLFQIQAEDVGVVHHRSKSSMRHIANKGRESRQLWREGQSN